MASAIGIYFWQTSAVADTDSKKCVQLIDSSRTAIRVDQRYGRASQLNNALATKGLFSEIGESNLCGPTCLVNVLKKVSTDQNMISVRGKPTDQIEYIVSQAAPSAGFTKNTIIEKGTTAFKLIKIFKTYLEELGIDLLAKVQSPVSGYFGKTKAIDIQEMKNAIKTNRAVILKIEAYPGRNGHVDWYADPRRHWIVVRGVDTANPNRIVILDPEHPADHLVVVLAPITWNPTEKITFTLEFENQNNFFGGNNKLTFVVSELISLNFFARQSAM